MDPPVAPPQWSPDGKWWWDGTRWRALNEAAPPPAPMPPAGDWAPPPVQSHAPVHAKRTLGLRVLLLVALAVTGMISALFSFFGLLGVSNGYISPGDILFAAVVLFLFGASLLAFAGILIQASWARPAAIIAGTAISLTCLGMVVGIPILIAASRANLSRARTNAPDDT